MKLQRHKSGQARIRLRGRDFYCGAFGTAEATERARRLIAQHQAMGKPSRYRPMTIEDLVELYLERARVLYPSGHWRNYAHALDPVHVLYGSIELDRFDLHCLATCRDAMVRTGYLRRRTVNQRMNRIRTVFRWARERGLYPPDRIEDLKSLRPLGPGQAGKESEQLHLRPTVHDKVIEATARHAGAPVGAMIRVQRLALMRPGEVVALNVERVELETRDGARLLVYRPRHKTEHHGLTREVLFGPRARRLLSGWITDARRRHRAGKGGYVFLTSDGEPYSVSAYRMAIRRACKAAGVDPWGPNQLRHAGATRAYETGDLETAKELLDHAHQRTTEVYVHRNEKRRAATWAAEHG